MVFSHYSVPFHWLVRGHMTSNNKTVSCQMLWAGNIAKTMMSNGKQVTVTRQMLTAVALPLSIKWLFVFHHFESTLTHLFCYITNHLMTGPLGNSEFCFPWISMFPEMTLSFSGNKIHCSPWDHAVIKC